MLNHILFKKLNRQTIDFESKLTNVKELQNLKCVLKYIEKRYLTLRSVENKANDNNVKDETKKKKKGTRK